MLKCENFNYETPFIDTSSLAFRNPKAIKNLYKFKRKFFAIENIEDAIHLVCLPMYCMEDYINGNIDEVPAINIDESNLSLIDKELKSLQAKHL